MTDSSDLTSIYEQVLGRSPDQSGMVSYTAMLDGGANLSTIESTVAHSPEAETDLEQIYEQVLGREADPSGLATYIGALSNGVSLAQVRAMIAASPEAQSRLEQIYNEVLGREADAGGLATYRDALANGSSLAQIRAIIASSGEVAGDLEQVYRNVLGRDADPGGLATYQSALGNGWTLSGVRSSKATSSEAQADVTSLFQKVLNRGPSTVELASAEAQLAQSASLDDLQQQLTSNGTLLTGPATLPQTDPVVTQPAILPQTDPLPTDPVIMPSQSGDIVGVRLQNTSGSTAEPSGYVTFGQVFMPGAVKPGDSLVARINGVNYAVQMNVKSTNADGSVRQAILTLDAPGIAAGGSVDLMLAKGTASAPSPAAPSASGLLASGYNVGVNFTFHNPDGTTTTDSASAGAALQAALNAGTVKTWLSGPGVNEYDVVTTVDGGKLKVEFDIRAYANGTTTTDVIFDNSWMFAPGKTDLNYDVSINQGGQQVYSASSVQQYLYSMWDHQVASAGIVSPNIQYNVPYLINTGAIPAYDTSFGVSDAAIQYNYGLLNATNTGPMGTAGVTTYMPGTGGRQDIGPQPNWVAQWLLSQNATAYQVMMADANASGSVPWHYTDESTGAPINGQTYPNFGSSTVPVNGWPQTSNTGSPSVDGDPWLPETAHMPDLNYLAYLTTGSHYQLELLQAEADFAIISVATYGTTYDTSNTVPMGFAANFVNIPNSSPGTNNISNGNQARGIAWELRTVAEAAYATPDSDPLKAYFTNELNIAMKGLVQEYIVDNANGQYGQLNGLIEGSFGPSRGEVTPWMEDYVVTSLAEVAGMNIPQASAEAVQMLQYMNNFVAGIFTNGSNGYNPLDGTPYYLHVNDQTTGAPYTSWSQLFNGNIISGWQQGMAGLPASPTELINFTTQTMGGYAAIAKAALADEITYTGSPQAIQAYGFVVGQMAYAFSLGGGSLSDGSGGTLTAAYQNYPQWSIMPRLADGTWLLNSQMQIDTSGASQVTLTATGGDSLLAVVGTGTATLNGGSGSSDLMFGGTGSTTFNPGPGNDYMFAAYNATGTQTFNDNTGNNYMYGSSAGPNVYVFAENNSGHDTIANFNVSTDRIRIGANLDGNGITSAAQLIAGATVSNGNTVLHLSSKDDITLLGVNQPSNLINSILVA